MDGIRWIVGSSLEPHAARRPPRSTDLVDHNRRRPASWLPTAETAEPWRAFGAVRGPTGAVVLVDRSTLTLSTGRWADIGSRAFDGNGERIQSPIGFTYDVDKPGVVELVTTTSAAQAAATSTCMRCLRVP